jgi:hypothetical protein
MIYDEIKTIARLGLEREEQDRALRDILWYIAREEENFRIRHQYYNEVRRWKK